MMTPDATIPLPIRVAIVEDHHELRESWRAIIDSAPDLCCVGDFPTAEAALREIPALRPDVVLMDINLPGMSGIECTRLLRERLPRLQVLILTVYEDSERIFEALEAGASGYLLKRTSEEQLLRAIAEVRGGGSPMTSEVARKVVQSFRKPARSKAAEDAKLTPREEQILKLLAQGYVTKEIADQLGISYYTTQTHLKNIYEKLHVRSRTEAVLRYLA
ncbi:MAG: response regulator transcription factor [Akkermansiaceae bacterium]|jgi:DNA-binding NarL/FixJ family response regulator|nr:response regulator transcription factor [Akkermansiaceae bacterium]